MKKQNTFYITTPIFYPNAELHMGNVYPVTLCDILARYHRAKGDTTYFLTGSDEHSTKVVKMAEKAGKSTEIFLETTVGSFKALFSALDISYDQFIRTSDREVHWPGATLMWNKLVEAGDIYKKSYQGLYCVGCEAFVTEKDLVNGKCQYHETIPELLSEENYFFKLSKYTEKVKAKIVSEELTVMPESRKSEILALLDRGLEDVSFSRPASKNPWAIPVPNDPTQTMYVWCDALVNYISAVGYGRDEKMFETYWPADAHVIGKDILRFHAAFWPAMLMSAGLPLPKTILVHGMILSGGRKMSKTLGNVIDPQILIAEYGKDAFRYFLARHLSTFEDSEITPESYKEAYNANLANGIGNLVSRVMKMVVSYDISYDIVKGENKLVKEYAPYLERFEINKAIDIVFAKIGELDAFIQTSQPFKTIKTDAKKAHTDIAHLAQELYTVGESLAPFMPETSATITALVAGKKCPPEPLFERKA